GGRPHRRGRRRHLVARQDCARRATGGLGRRRRRYAIEREDRRAPGGRALRTERLRGTQRRRCAQGDRGAARRVEAVYSTPFLAHATMEPMNCTSRVTADRAEAWVPTQNAEASLAALSEVAGIPIAQCEVYRPDLGGGFGRRGGSQDYTRQ